MVTQHATTSAWTSSAESLEYPIVIEVEVAVRYDADRDEAPAVCGGIRQTGGEQLLKPSCRANAERSRAAVCRLGNGWARVLGGSLGAGG